MRLFFPYTKWLEDLALFLGHSGFNGFIRQLRSARRTFGDI
jgi:hypothetical protein